MMLQGDRRFFWSIASFTILLTLIPHFVGWVRVAGGDFKSYQAYNTFSRPDTNVYYSYINQARQGALVFDNLFTGEPQRAVLFHPVWLIGGWLGAITNLPTPIIFQLLRVVAALGLLIVAYRFCVWLGLNTVERKMSLVLIALSSGLGIFLTGWQGFSRYQDFFSTDISIAESNTFATLYHSPLFPLSQMLIILTLQHFVDSFRLKKIRPLLLTGIFVLIISITHTYDLVTIAAVLISYCLTLLLTNEIRVPADLWRYVRNGLLLLPFIVPAALYYILVLYREPAIAGWLTQNMTLSPSIWGYLLGFGLLTPLALVAIKTTLSSQRRSLYLPIVWLTTSMVIIYLPYLSFQRRLSSGMHLPLAILATVGLLVIWRLANRWTKIGAKTIVTIGLIVLIATPIGIIVRDSLYLARQDYSEHDYFFTADEVAAQMFLEQAAGSTGIIYSDPWQANNLAGLGRRVFIGHSHQTINWDTKRAALDDFFSDWTDKQRYSYFTENSIGWLYYGARERILGPWDPHSATWLIPAFTAGDITIYRFSGG